VQKFSFGAAHLQRRRRAQLVDLPPDMFTSCLFHLPAINACVEDALG
jgi:hypothetical protein